MTSEVTVPPEELVASRACEGCDVIVCQEMGLQVGTLRESFVAARAAVRHLLLKGEEQEMNSYLQFSKFVKHELARSHFK